MEKVESFRDLVVYQQITVLCKELFELTKTFPKAETYSLTDQIRRSSRSVGAQVAEAWGRRRYENHFISKLTDADGEQLETEHWIETARTCSYRPDEKATKLQLQCASIGNLLDGMIRKSSWFCTLP